MFCTRCGHRNEASALFCAHCGFPTQVPASPALPRDDPTDLTDLYKAVIGPHQQGYYLERFARFDAAGKALPSWHWPALWMTFYWLLHRRLWWEALVYAMLPFVVGIPAGWLSTLLEAWGPGGGRAMGWISTLAVLGYLVLPAVYANAYYHRHCRRLMAQARASSADRDTQLKQLAARGGTSPLLTVLLWVLLFTVLAAGLAAWWVPRFQQHSAQARVGAAAALAEKASVAVGRYAQREGDWPRDLPEAGFDAVVPEDLGTLDYDSDTGLITLTLAVEGVQGKSLMMVPEVKDDDTVRFTCLSHDLPDSILPPRCRLRR